MPVRRARRFVDAYTRDLTSQDVQRLFTRDTPEAYRYFTRGTDLEALAREPWYRRIPTQVRLVFTGFTMRLSPPRRALYGLSVLAVIVGMIVLFRGVGPIKILLFPFSVWLPLPVWENGALWLFLGFVGVNLLILMEVADRLSLKSDLEIARDIQLAMLPAGIHHAGDATVCGVTRPANTVGGDFFDILPLPDGRVVIAVGDVAGKGSPAALLMALLLAMLRTLVDEGMETARLVARLNVQVARHSPASRFITLFFGVYDPRDGRLEFVNAGHLPPLVRHAGGHFERIDNDAGGLALGMFPTATYETRAVTIGPGDTLVLYSDGITEAENDKGAAFEEAGLQGAIAANAMRDADGLARALLAATEKYAGEVKLVDDLTALVLRRT
ncbi:MAG TPA: PP2C family protein-serine/threonine phosphatase [Vicinamibacterales bacterium]|nr:PP2C family protein-serine/threonine phosphatase [Vicinamibacterales bacterium]